MLLSSDTFQTHPSYPAQDSSWNNFHFTQIFFVQTSWYLELYWLMSPTAISYVSRHFFTLSWHLLTLSCSFRTWNTVSVNQRWWLIMQNMNLVMCAISKSASAYSCAKCFLFASHWVSHLSHDLMTKHLNKNLTSLTSTTNNDQKSRL